MPDDNRFQKVQIVNADGTLLQGATGSASGSAGKDYSANPAAITGNLLATVPVNNSRSYIEVQNQSQSQIQIVRDDGAGNQATSILLASGGGAGQQGGGWTSNTFRGRLRIYAPTGSQVAVYED